MGRCDTHEPLRWPGNGLGRGCEALPSSAAPRKRKHILGEEEEEGCGVSDPHSTGTGLRLIVLVALRAGQGLGGSGLTKMTAFSGEGGLEQGGDRA